MELGVEKKKFCGTGLRGCEIGLRNFCIFDQKIGFRTFETFDLLGLGFVRLGLPLVKYKIALRHCEIGFRRFLKKKQKIGFRSFGILGPGFYGKELGSVL